MEKKRKALAVCIAIPLAVGALSALLTASFMSDFIALDQPPLSPPGWLFPIIWTALYILMGIASWLVYAADAPAAEKRAALTVYGLQLAVNFFWPLVFFVLEAYLFAFFWLLLLWGLILITAIAFYRIDKRSGYLLIPYLLWVTFAGYLSLSIAILN